MNLLAGVERRFHSGLRLSLVGIVVVAGIMLAVTISIWNRRDEAIARSHREAGNLGIVLAAQGARAFQAVDLVMQETAALVRSAGIDTPDQFRARFAQAIHKFLADRVRSLPQANEEGAVLADWRRQSSWLLLGALAAAIGFGLLFRALARQSCRLERQAEDLEQAAAALGNSEARFRDFATTSSDWLWETDAEHRFTYQSDNIRTFGQDPRKRLGRTRMELAADAGVEAEKWAEHRALLDRHEPFRDFVYRRKVGDDPEASLSVSGKPIFDAQGNFLGYRGTVRDITREIANERHLRGAKSAAEAANMAKSQFLANMSHELRTPLNAIIGFSEMMLHGLAGALAPQQQEYSDLIRQSGQHLLNVINEILDLARVDAGKLELREEEHVDPRQVIDSCIRLVNARTNCEIPRLAVEIEDPVPELTVDPTRLTQILLNLLSNAAKFTPREGTVQVALRRHDEGGVEFEVADTGIGMSAAEIMIALEPFGQIDSAHSRQHEGTGLGLPLARRLAELHGGTLTVRSEKGRGTTVTVTLPAWRVHDASPADFYDESLAAAD